MGDAAPALTNSVEETWGQETTRLMCWAHQTRATDRSDHLKALRALNPDFTQKLLDDIDKLQWMVHNVETFRIVINLLKEKYDILAKDKEHEFKELPQRVSKFFNYFFSVWVESREFRWFEGAHPWGPGHNQSIEGINKAIKENYTFRHKLEMGELFR